MSVDLTNVPLDDLLEEWQKLDRRLLTRMGIEVLSRGRIEYDEYECCAGDKGVAFCVPSPSRTREGNSLLLDWIANEHHWHYIEERRNGADVYVRVSVQEGADVLEGEAYHADPRAALALAVDRLTNGSE